MISNQVKITVAFPSDVYGIRAVQKATWLATYPNEVLGITREDIVSRFADDETPQGKQRMEERKARLLDPNTHTSVAKDGDTVIGFCMAQREGKSGRLGAIYLLPEYQGLGLGRKLADVALEWLGARDIFVNVVSYNQKAILFYERCGFVKTGKVVEDAVASLPSGKVLPEIEMMRSATF